MTVRILHVSEAEERTEYEVVVPGSFTLTEFKSEVAARMGKAPSDFGLHRISKDVWGKSQSNFQPFTAKEAQKTLQELNLKDESKLVAAENAEQLEAVKKEAKKFHAMVKLTIIDATHQNSFPVTLSIPETATMSALREKIMTDVLLDRKADFRLRLQKPGSEVGLLMLHPKRKLTQYKAVNASTIIIEAGKTPDAANTLVIFAELGTKARRLARTSTEGQEQKQQSEKEIEDRLSKQEFELKAEVRGLASIHH